MRLTQGQVRTLLKYMENKFLPYMWTESLPLELCKHIRYKWGKWRCTKLHWQECECDRNGCCGFNVRETEESEVM